MSMSSDGIPTLAEDATAGVGNLADELADAWGEDELDQSAAYYDNNGIPNTGIEVEETGGYTDMHDFGFGGSLQSPPQVDRYQEDRLQPRGNRRKSTKNRNHQRTQSTYDGSEYGNDSDLESDDGVSHTLAARMADIEALARFGKGDAGLDTDNIITRTVVSLRDLGSQSGIENGASRLMTTHASLVSHLAHQTRSMQTLTHSILKTPFPDMDEDSLEEITTMISDLVPLLPFPPQPSALQSLQMLISSTAEITHLLRALSDTLHESRLVTNTASRRLKTVKDMVSDSRKEEEEREVGVAFIERGRWDERLKKREAQRICGEVVMGFESTCESWRQRLVSQLGEVGA